MSDTKLLPCPMCGGRAKWDARSKRVWCFKCGISSRLDEKSEATSNWNTRTPDPRLAAAQGLADALKAMQLQLLQSDNQTEYAQEANDMANAALTAWEKAVR